MSGGYPPAYTQTTDFLLAKQNGEAVDGGALAHEFANLAETVNQLRAFIKAGFTSNRKWQPSSALAQDLVEQFEYTATAGQTEFLFTGGTTATPASDKVRVFVNGVLIKPSTVTLNSDGVEIAARSAGDTIVVELFNDQQNVREDLSSTLANVGASLIGVQDALTFFSGDDLETVLAEIGTSIKNILEATTDLSQFLRADGSVPMVAPLDFGGQRGVNAADGEEATDFATVGQLDALSAIYGDLSVIFLALAGGDMAGPIGMNDNPITGVPTIDLNDDDAVAAAATDAANLQAVVDALAQVSAAYLKKSGGTLTGPLNAAGQAINNIPDAESDQQPTSLSQVNALISAGGLDSAGFVGGLGDLYIPATAECPSSGDFPDVSRAGLFDMRGDVVWPADVTDVADGVTIRVTGDLDLSGRTLTVAPYSTLLEAGLFGDRVTNTRPVDALAYQDTVGIPADRAGPGAGGAGGPGGPGDGQPRDQVSRIWPGLLLTDSQQTDAIRHAWKAGKHLHGAVAAGNSVFDYAPALPGGSLRVLVDGDLTLTGATINAVGAQGSDESAAADGLAGGGGGSVVFIVKGHVYCGDESGALINAAGARGGEINAEQFGGGGGGYVAVIAKQIHGTLNISARGGPGYGTNGTGDASPGGGGVVEVSRESVADDETLNIDVTAGDVVGAPVGDYAGEGKAYTELHLHTRLAFYGSA